MDVSDWISIVRNGFMIIFQLVRQFGLISDEWIEKEGIVLSYSFLFFRKSYIIRPYSVRTVFGRDAWK